MAIPLAHHPDSPWSVFLVFLRLGLTSFGGPIAHLGYFRDEFVTRRRWLSERSYADLVALCQFLPGPASSQVGIALGLQRAGYGGALAAWAGFTLPSALLLIVFALGIAQHSEALPTGVLHGLKVVAVAVVAQAVWGMARTLCRGLARVSLMLIAACVALLTTSAWGQVGAIAVAGVAGLLFLTPTPNTEHEALPNQGLALVDAFYRSGALVFGGGHVVLPLLQAEVVAPHWISNDLFLAGYGAAQAVPGPLFTFAAFLGAAMYSPPNGWLGGLICLLAIFAPAFLLVFGALPFWETLRRSPRTQAALAGVNTGVVGLLLAALYHPVLTSAIYTTYDIGLAVLALVALMVWRLPPWLVVIASGGLGWLLSVGVG